MDTAKLERLAHRLLDEHGLSERGWVFRWDRAKTALGSCSHGKRVITLSRLLAEMNSEDEMIDTLLHEIAHALAGPNVGHGVEWKRIARRIGAKPERVAHEAVGVPASWRGECPRCGEVIERYRLTKTTRRSACLSCCRAHNGGRWSSDFLLLWRRSES